MTDAPRPLAERLALEHFGDVVDVLADAFSDYPVMRFVLGPDGNTHARLVTLIGFFVFRRIKSGGPMFGIRDNAGRLIGAAVMTLPSEPDPRAEVLRRRDETWDELGQRCRERYDVYGAAAKTVLVTEPHHHLNMIGIRRASHGRGYARPLLEAAFALAVQDTSSAGLSLTTETPANVKLYEHFGFEVVGEVRVSPDVHTWGMFRRTR